MALGISSEFEALVSHNYLLFGFVTIPQLTTNTRGSKKNGYIQMIMESMERFFNEQCLTLKKDSISPE